MVRVEFWWLLEKLSDRMWHRLSRDGVTAGWFDEVTAFTYSRRKNAERRETRRPRG